MAVPKQRKTKSRRNQRRMHIHLDKPTLCICPQCKEKKLAHMICKECGYYNGKEIVNVLKDKTKKKKEEDGGEDKKAKSLTMEGLSKKEKK